MNTEQPMMCSLCKLDYTTWGQYEEHLWSMIHHKQLEMQYGSGKMHVCSLCNAKTDSLSSYAKHLVSDVHLRAMEERKKSRQLQIQIQKQHTQRNHLGMMGPRYSQTFQGGWMRGAWEQNQRKIWPRYFDRNRYSNSPQYRMWSAKSDFEAPPKKVTSPHSSSMKSPSRSSLLKSSASSRGGIKPGSCQLKTPCSVKQPTKAGADEETCKTRITKSSIDVKGLSSEVKPSSKQNTKEKTLRTTIKATSRLVVKSKTGHSTENRSVPKLSSHVTSSTLKGTRLSLSFKTSTLSTNCKRCGKGDQDKNGKNRNGSSESEKNQYQKKYQNCEPSTSTPAISESTGEKLSASGLKCSKSEDKQEQEESTKQKKRTSSVEKTIEASVANGSGNRMNTNSQSDVIKRGTELGTDFDLEKARRMDMFQMLDRIGKASAAREIRASMEKTEKMLDLSEETVVKEVNLTSDGTPKTNLRGDEERVSIQSAQPTASTIRASSVSKTSGKSSDLNSMALPSSSVDGKSQNTLSIGKTPPEVSRLKLPQSNPDLGEKDPMSGVMPSVASSEDPLESIELSGEASVTRVQLPPSLQRELTKLLVKSQEPRPRPNLAAARSRLHAGEHHQAQVVESPDRMVQKLLMKLLDSPKSRDRQVQQIEELQRLLVQASKKGSERARFGVQQLPEISLDVLESLLKSGQLKPLLSEDGMKLDKNHPVALHLTELADSKEQLRRSFLVNSPVNKPHPESGTAIVIKQEKIESETRVKTEPSSPVPNVITIKSEPNLDSSVSTDVASSIQTMPSPLQAPSLTIQLQGGSGPNKIIKITDVRSLSCTSKSIDPKEVGNLTTEADQQQPALPKVPSKKASEKTPRKRRTSPLDLKDILLELSLKEERFHKRLITVESSLRTTKELISKKQKHVRKLKEQRSKISQDVTAIRTKRLQLLKEATTSSLLSPGSQKSLTKACQKKCQKLTSQASCQRSSSGSTPISGLLSSLTAKSSNSCPVTNPRKIHATSVACTKSYPVTKVSFRGSSIQGKSQGPASRTICQGSMGSTKVVSGAEAGSKLPQRFTTGSSLQNPVEFHTRNTEPSLSRSVNNLYNIQTTEACTSRYFANSAPTYKDSVRESSLQGKSQGPADRTICQGAMCSTEVVSGAKPGSKLSQSFAAGSSLQNTVKFQTRTTESSLSRAVNNLYNIPTTTEACTRSYSANSAPTNNVSFRGSSLQGKSQGPAGRTIFQGAMCSTEVVSGAKPGSKLPQSFATGSSLQNPVKFQTRTTESSLTGSVDNLHNIQKTTEACTNRYSTCSAPTYISFRESSLQDKSQGPAGRTLFQGSMSSTPVSASGSSPGSGPLSSSTTGSFLKILANTPLKIHAEATIAGSVKKGNTTSDSVDKPQQVKVKVEPVYKVKEEPVDKVKVERIDPESSPSCPVNNPFKIQATSVAFTNPCPVTHSTPTNQISFRGSSIQGKSQGPAGRTIFQGPSTLVCISGSSPSNSSTGSSLIPFNIHAEATTAGSAKKSNTTSGSVDKPQQVQIKVEPVDPGYQDVGIASLHAALVPLPETSLCEQARKAPSSLFGTSTSSNTLLETGVQGQSRGKKQIIGDISNTEKTNQGHQMTPRTKKRLYLSVSASPLSKKARTTEGLKEVLAKAKSSRSEIEHPTRSAVSSDTAAQKVPSALKKSPQSTFVCEIGMPVLKLRKIELQDTTSIIKMEKWLSVTTEEGKGSSKGSSNEMLDFSVFEISSDSESSAPEEPTTSGVKSSSRIKSKLSAFKTYSSSAQLACEQQSTPEAKCGLFKAHCKAVHGLCNVKGRLCTVSADSTAKVFNIKDFSCHKGFTSHKSSVNCAAAWSHRDTDYLFTGSSDEIVRVYNMQTFSCEKVICCNSRVMCLLLRWETLYAGLANGFVTVINLQDFTTETLRCKRDILIECMITASYRGEACLVIAYSDSTVGVHALGDGRQHMYLKGHTGRVLCLGVLDHHVYSGSVDRKVIIHDLKTGIRTKTIKHHGSAVTALIVGTPYLITASLDKKVRLFSAQNGKLGRVIAECPYMITCMIRIQKMLYVGCTTGYVEAIDVKPNSKRNVSVTKKPKKIMFNCEWFECGVPVNVSNSTKHLNDYHIIRKKEHQCKWGFCDVVIDKALPNCQELLWEHVKAHIQPKA